MDPTSESLDLLVDSGSDELAEKWPILGHSSSLEITSLSRLVALFTISSRTFSGVSHILTEAVFIWLTASTANFGRDWSCGFGMAFSVDHDPSNAVHWTASLAVISRFGRPYSWTANATLVVSRRVSIITDQAVTYSFGIASCSGWPVSWCHRSRLLRPARRRLPCRSRC
jgi:hypothetical protein